ncbi:hypothetical protein QR680_010095 [Steinernema hermaphroditum]|uniref:Uncharacterized protein n=1 Tax=Steinernema hermaphroditum TaxID=289476 RepID=A0AA39IMQ0_9BILA|nr:hypothetical protein QR680_010095 [Steinernema hermaphroditum]
MMTVADDQATQAAPAVAFVTEVVGDGPARGERHLKRMAEQRHHVKQAADCAPEGCVMTVAGRRVNKEAVVRPKGPNRSREEQANIDLKRNFGNRWTSRGRSSAKRSKTYRNAHSEKRSYDSRLDYMKTDDWSACRTKRRRTWRDM